MTLTRVLGARRFLLTLACAALPLTAGAAVNCPMPAEPFGAKAEMVTPAMRANGLDTTIRALTIPMPVEGVLAYYRALWAPLATPTRPGSIEQESNGWKIISSLEGRCLTTVQVMVRDAGSYALVAVAQAPDPNARPKVQTIDFPAPPGSRIVSDATHADVVRNARTVVAVNSARQGTNVEFYANGLRSQGWLIMMQKSVTTAKGPGEVIVLKKGTGEMSVVIAPGPDGQTSIVANIVDRP